jgi:hypothetical protein
MNALKGISRNGMKLGRNALVEKALSQNMPWIDHVRIILRSPLLASRLRPARTMGVDDQFRQRLAEG